MDYLPCTYKIPIQNCFGTHNLYFFARFSNVLLPINDKLLKICNKTFCLINNKWDKSSDASFRTVITMRRGKIKSKIMKWSVTRTKWQKKIRNANGCVVRIKNSVTRVTVLYHDSFSYVHFLRQLHLRMVTSMLLREIRHREFTHTVILYQLKPHLPSGPMTEYTWGSVQSLYHF